MDYLREVEKELKLKHYSSDTRRTYLHYLKNFIASFPESNINEISKADIKKLLVDYIENNNASYSTVSQYVNSIQFLYETVHTLRHSFVTHLLEQEVDMRYIQELLGHQSSRTTEIYTHITRTDLRKITSPIDKMEIFNEL